MQSEDSVDKNSGAKRSANDADLDEKNSKKIINNNTDV